MGAGLVRRERDGVAAGVRAFFFFAGFRVLKRALREAGSGEASRPSGAQHTASPGRTTGGTVCRVTRPPHSRLLVGNRCDG